MDKQASNRIKQWMKSIIEEQAWERLDDLHIDQVASTFKTRDNWVSASYESFKEAILIQQAIWENERFRIALAIPLVARNKPKNLDFHSLQEVSENLHSYTPPSLYLFPEKFPSWENAISKGITQPNLAISVPIEYCFYTEWYDAEDKEYCYTLWISTPIGVVEQKKEAEKV